MIGDSEVDVRTAKAAGIPIILVSFGYAKGPLHGLSPDAMIDHYDALAGHAATLLNGVARHPFPGLNA
jgi:phosphoglycolate phosphatase